MNEDILNDEKVISELYEKRGEYETKLNGQKEKMGELENTLKDLEGKSGMDDISDSTKEKIGEVIAQVKEKIGEAERQIEDLDGKIKEIDETLAPKPEPEEDKKTTEIEAKIKELEEKIAQKETERAALEAQKNNAESGEFIASIDAQIQVIGQQKERLNQTVSSIDEKINDSGINDATRERLEEMRDEVHEKIDELQDKIDELQDKKEEYEDQINDKIDEINDEIAEIQEEIEEQKNNTVDEQIIDEVKKSSGFGDLGSFIGKITDTVSAALANVRIPEIKIPPISEIRIPKFESKIEITENKEEITFDDIIAIAPFAKKETLDKLVNKLDGNDNIEFDKIKRLAPFLSKETLMRCVRRSGKIDMKRLKSLAPFLGSDAIDEIISTMM